jgi:hypothetical protein
VLAGWNTPRATDGENGGPNQAGGALPADAAELAGWATPACRDAKDGACETADVPVNALLGRQAAKLVEPLAGWHTPDTRPDAPNTRSNCKSVAAGLGNQASGLTPSSSPAGTGKPGESPRLNPAFSLWLMGFPPEWMASGMRAVTAFRSRGRSRGGSRS